MFVNSVNSNYVSFGWLCHTHVPDFMLMCCSVCVGAMTAKRARPANGLCLPVEKVQCEHTVYRTAYEFKTDPHYCMLKEIGKRLGEVNGNGFVG